MNCKATLVHIICTAFLVLLVSVCHAQQAPQYSLYMLNKYQFNPAYAGMDGSLSINGFYRTQWVGVPGNPVQQNVNAHMPLYMLNGAAGISFDHEKIGAEETIKGKISYNYVLETGVGFFSFGVAAGFHQKSLDGASLRAPDGDYEGSIVIHNDANLPTTKVSGVSPELAFGVYYGGESFEAGIALTEMLIGKVQMPGASYKGSPAVNLFGEYFVEGLGAIDLYPSFLVRTDLTITQVEAGVRAVYDDFLMLGAGVRGYSGTTLDAVTLLLGLKVSPNLTVAYGYDITVSELQQVSSGSHELSVNYNLNRIIGAGLPPPVIYSPRFY